MSQPARRTSRAAALSVALAVGLTLTASACSGDSDSKPKAGASTSASSAPVVATQVSFGTFTGGLPQANQEELSAAIQEVVDGWINKAYIGGGYPRSDFADSWPGFTPGAQALAKRDADLMSNADIGAKIDGVEPVSRTLKLDVISRNHRPVGVTARVVLTFNTTGDLAETIRVQGRLYLTPGSDGWQVFGYDVTKGTA